MEAEAIIYLDHQAHSPIDARALAAMNAAYRACDFNAGSAHTAGDAAARALGIARAHVADLLAAKSSEVVFVSGATEANNLAFAGLADDLRRSGRTRVVVSAGEHPSVLAAAAAMRGFDVVEAGLDRDGLVKLGRLADLMGPCVGIVSVAAANHELGTVQPLAEIASMTRACGAVFHSDLAQAAGKVAVSAVDLDLASVSSHKLGGPSGIGALYVRRTVRRRLGPLLHGGGQEGGLRAGTVPIPLCVGFGEACRIARSEMSATAERTGRLRSLLLDGLRAVGGVVVNGGMRHRLPGNLNVSFDGVDGEALVMALRAHLAFSTGSACTSAALEPSHVLGAIGADERRARGAVRFSLGPETTRAEIGLAVDAVGDAVRSLRAITRKVA